MWQFTPQPRLHTAEIADKARLLSRSTEVQELFHVPTPKEDSDEVRGKMRRGKPDLK